MIRPVFKQLRLLFAIIGCAAMLGTLALLLMPQLREQTLQYVHDWLSERNQSAVYAYQANSLFKLKAVSPTDLSPEQARMAAWLSKKYRITDVPMATIVAYAYQLGAEYKLAPSLILAIAAIESNFHPYVQSPAGAQGMMQVMPRIHAKRYEAYGGSVSAFNALINMRVGVEVLVDCIKLKNGSLNEGLRFYFGGDLADGANGSGYLTKVLAEQERLLQVAQGLTVE